MQAIFMGRADQIFGTARDAQVAINAVAKPNDLAITIHGLFTRALCWSSSVSRLSDMVTDFQAHSAAARALFEILVDIVLLTKGDAPLDKLLAWEDAMRLKSAERAAADGDTTPEMLQFIATQKPLTTAAKAKYWPPPPPEPGEKPKKPSLPMRWTGSDLITDGRMIETLGKYGAERVISKNYDLLNWNTHGSGLVIARRFRPSSIVNVTVIALVLSTETIAHIVTEALEYFGLLDEAWKKKIQIAKSGWPESEIRAAVAEYQAKLDKESAG